MSEINGEDNLKYQYCYLVSYTYSYNNGKPHHGSSNIYLDYPMSPCDIPMIEKWIAGSLIKKGFFTVETKVVVAIVSIYKFEGMHIQEER